MSKIQGVPFIQSVINSLTAELKNDLLDLVNGEEKTPVFRSLINKQHAITAGTDKNKVQFVFLETWNKNYTGYLIYNNSYCVLVGFNANTQDMSIVNIDVAKQTYNLVKQPLSILEFRFCLQDAAEHITSDEIDSGSTPADKLLAADGEGGVKWVYASDSIKESDVETGDAVKLFGFDAQGNLVADDLPEGILVDDSIIEDSPNAVSGGAVYDALEEIGGDITDINAELETKANVDGNYPTMTVGVADQLSPYDDESGDDQDEPFSFQATGTGNGTQPDFSTGSIALMKEKQGNSVVVNQYETSQSITGTYSDVVFTYDSSKNCTHVEGTASNTISNIYFDRSGTIKTTPGHKFLLFGCPKGGSASTYYLDPLVGDGANYAYGQPRDIGNGVIFDAKDGNNNPTFIYGIRLYISNGTVINADFNAFLIDLTQWFGSNDNIPSHLLSHPENFFRYYQGSLAYNTGELVNANGRYLKAVGRQQWDEETKIVENALQNKNPIKLVPNAQYFFYPANVLGSLFFTKEDGTYVRDVSSTTINGGKLFTAPSEIVYLGFECNTSYGTTYNHDITISLHYSGESGYDQYYPYEVLTNNDTGTEVLRSAGSVSDSKAPDGTITRRIKQSQLGALVDSVALSDYYTNLLGANVYSFAKFNDAKDYGGYTTKLIADKIICEPFKGTGYAGQYIFGDASEYSYMAVLPNMDLNTAKTFLASLTFNYELAEPTTEQGTPYSENIVIDDFGSMDFSGTSGVPQGNLIFYPVDYKAFIDTLYDYTEGTPSNIALKSDLSADKTELQGVDTQLLNAIGGTLRHLLVAENSGLDFNDTNYLDLGSVDWTKGGTAFSTTGFATVLKIPASSENCKLLCSNYKMICKSANSVSGNANTYEVYITSGGQLVWYYPLSEFADGAAFKAAMKGVLLAYEKASE